MGSKRAMLQNGLGHVLDRHVPKYKRFIDLFSGSGAVAAHVALRNAIPVVAYDLQTYSAVLAGSVISRDRVANVQKSWRRWEDRALAIIGATDIPSSKKLTRSNVNDLRAWSAVQFGRPITAAYGGHYFSPRQAVWFDALRATLPRERELRLIALASLIRVASQCAAAPGHTAQPFQPTRTAGKFLAVAWGLDVSTRVATVYSQVAKLFAKKRGKAEVKDANKAAKEVRETDLVFIDPPYSGVHYSRFYHVLETIARGKCGQVTGTGRYPPSEQRPRSKYSVSTESEDALDDLLATLADRGATAILTFPDHSCSNGLSGDSVVEIASEYFAVRSAEIDSRFSTLGGRSDSDLKQKGRMARHDRRELVLLLRPKR